MPLREQAEDGQADLVALPEDDLSDRLHDSFGDSLNRRDDVLGFSGCAGCAIIHRMRSLDSLACDIIVVEMLRETTVSLRHEYVMLTSQPQYTASIVFARRRISATM